MWAADGLWVFAFDVPFGALFAQLVLDCIKVQNAVDGGGVGRHFPASYSYGVVTFSIIGVKLHDLIQIGTGWLSCKAEPAEVIQPFVNDWFKAIVLQAIIKKETLLFPSILGSNHGITSPNNCAAESGWHAFGRG
ncbi:hypothetical protein V6N13_074315 [Hibiscus sabdariffa]